MFESGVWFKVQVTFWIKFIFIQDFVYSFVFYEQRVGGYIFYLEVWFQLEFVGVFGDKSRVGVFWGLGGCFVFWRDFLVISYDVSIDVLFVLLQEYFDFFKELMSSNFFLYCNNFVNDRNRFFLGTRCSNWVSFVVLSLVGSSFYVYQFLFRISFSYFVC